MTEKLLLTVEEVANTLGYSKYYTYQLIRNGEIASMKGNGKKRDCTCTHNRTA